MRGTQSRGPPRAGRSCIDGRREGGIQTGGPIKMTDTVLDMGVAGPSPCMAPRGGPHHQGPRTRAGRRRGRAQGVQGMRGRVAPPRKGGAKPIAPVDVQVASAVASSGCTHNGADAGGMGVADAATRSCSSAVGALNQEVMLELGRLDVQLVEHMQLHRVALATWGQSLHSTAPPDQTGRGALPHAPVSAPG